MNGDAAKDPSMNARLRFLADVVMAEAKPLLITDKRQPRHVGENPMFAAESIPPLGERLPTPNRSGCRREHATGSRSRSRSTGRYQQGLPDIPLSLGAVIGGKSCASGSTACRELVTALQSRLTRGTRVAGILADQGDVGPLLSLRENFGGVTDLALDLLRRLALSLNLFRRKAPLHCNGGTGRKLHGAGDVA
jgi:hypothetical protein